MALVTSVGASLKNTWGFSPQSIPGLQLWLDGADITSMVLSGSSVTQWNDKSGNGYNFTNNGGSTNPTPDPLMGLLFTTTRSFSNSSVPVPSNYTLMLVGNLTSPPAGFGRMININASIDGFGYLGTYNDGLNTFATFTGTGGGAWFDTNANTPTTTIASSPNLSIMEMTVSGTVLTPYFNGTTLNAKTNSGSTSSTTGMCLNGILLSSQGVDGHYAEVLLFNSVLTTAQRQQVEGYLATKWRLKANLPTTHPYSAATRVPFNRPFFPTDIPGCSLWLDGADSGSMVFSSGTTLSTWRDKSGTGNDAVAFTKVGTPSFSTTALNGLPAVTYNAGGFDGSLAISGTTLHAFAVTTIPVITNFTPLLTAGLGTNEINTPSGAIVMQVRTSGTVMAAYRNGVQLGDIPLVANTPFIAESIFDGANHTMFKTGTVGTTAASVGSFATVKYCTGNTLDHASTGYNGSVSELLIYGSGLSVTQRQQIEQYLAWKWNLVPSLPTAHPGKLLPAFGTVSAPPAVSFLVVGGGGGGGSRFGGGGGAGGFLTGTLAVWVSTSYTITVGAGGIGGAGSGTSGSGGQNTLGAQAGGRGNLSVFSIITASGGGGGGAGDIGSGVSGASGGGSAGRAAAGADPYAGPTPGGTGIPGQGFAGAPSRAGSYLGGGGGGAGGAAVSPSGGIGRTSSITGTAVIYAGGGGGGGSFDPSPTFGGAQNGWGGGLGGGGRGGPFSGGTATAGTANTGGGGGGGAYNSATASFPNNNQPGAAGGSGVVILAYPSTYNGLLSFIDAGLTFTQNFTETNIVYRFTAGTGNVRW